MMRCNENFQCDEYTVPAKFLASLEVYPQSFYIYTTHPKHSFLPFEVVDLISEPLHHLQIECTVACMNSCHASVSRACLSTEVSAAHLRPYAKQSWLATDELWMACHTSVLPIFRHRAPRA